MKKLTEKWLEKRGACADGISWFKTCSKENPSEVMDALLAEKKLDWANWLIARLLSPKDRVRYAIFAAEQVIDIFEKAHPNDKRPRKAIEAAKAVLKKNNKTARAAAWAAAGAAWAAAGAAGGAGDAAGAAWAAGDAAWAAWAAAWAARAAGDAAGPAMKEKIIRYGMGLCFGREA